MRATDNRLVNAEQAPAVLRRRSFFGRLVLIAAGLPFVGGAMRGLVSGGTAGGPAADRKSISVQLNPLAVPRTSKGSTPNG